MISLRRLFPLSLLALFMSSCGQVYSPYLLLPPQPLKADEMQAVVTAGGLPSLDLNSPSVNVGGTGLLRYGITDHFSMQGEVWTSSWLDYHPSGFSLEGVALLSKPAADWRFAVIPRVALMTSQIQLEGWGVSGTLAAWAPEWLGGHPYLGIGALAGAADAHGNEPNYHFGFGGLLNAGMAYTLTDHVSVNGEFSTQGIAIHDSPGQYKYNGFWVWGVGMGYKF